MKIEIVTPEGKIVDVAKANALQVPTSAGVITIQEDHVPLMSIIVPGEVFIEIPDSDDIYLAISKGVMLVNRPTTIQILADTAERAENIDIQRAEEARLKALDLRSQQESIANMEYAFLQSKIEKELARVEVGKKWKKFRNL